MVLIHIFARCFKITTLLNILMQNVRDLTRFTPFFKGHDENAFIEGRPIADRQHEGKIEVK